MPSSGGPEPRAMPSSGDPTQLDNQERLEQRNASAASTIQRYWKDMQSKRLEVRDKFCQTLSALALDMDWKCFGPSSTFISQLVFFFNAKKEQDVDLLCQICDILLDHVKCGGDLVSLFAGVESTDSSNVQPFVSYRVRKLALICLQALHEKRFAWVSQPEAPFGQLLEFFTCLLNAFPTPERTYVDGMIPTEIVVNNFLDIDLQKHMSTMIQHLVNAAVSRILSIDCSVPSCPSSSELQFVASISNFLHSMLRTALIDGILTELVYNTEIVSSVWSFIKSCNTNDKWQSLSQYHSSLLPDTPGWVLPLSIFCPMYSHLFRFMDIVDLKQCEKPVPPEDLPSLVSILTEALWELMLALHTPSGSTKSPYPILYSVRTGLCELLIQLEDWNNIIHFVPPTEFCSKMDFSDEFANQAVIVGTFEAEIIKLAPFLVPLAIRFEIFQLRLEADHLSMADSREASSRIIEISKSNLLEDSFNKLSLLSAKDLKGKHGMREAGIDGGGIFRDFMNNVTKSAFGMGIGLFKETADHLLYPNSESDRLQYFHFLGVLLGKARYERIPNGLLFAPFFLKKLKQKATFLNDLFSLDPELYQSLLSLKESAAISYLYFSSVDGKELLPGGKKMHVTVHNVITYIHLFANYQLNCQNREQTAQVLRGFQEIIPKEWIDMFNENEFQLLISGPLSLNVEDLQLNTNYGGEYGLDHEVIVIFWKVVRRFSPSDHDRLLTFVTGSPRGPVRGFGTLDPKFCIISTGDDTDRLPSASTCVNLLHLPPYQTEETMYEKLTQAISSKSGFDLA